ncbi:MAG TPA: iron-sulfur cluster assembly scaffold protein [Candidatus Bilamarchaeum sp.]|nr:iron-sulfur cluster assembly scaffold protein [Candidatus Bilamarchaeum sp.]
MEELYQEFIIELYKNPLNFGRLEGADYKAQIYNSTCGDMIELFIRVKDGRVAEAKFTGKGCAISQASASLFTGFLRGKTLAELSQIEKEDVLKLIRINLEKNPSRMKCALLPLDALRQALK